MRAVSAEEIGQIERIPEDRREEVTVIDAARLVDGLIILKPRAALFEGRVEAAKLEAHAGAKAGGAIAQKSGGGIRIAVADECRDSSSRARVPIVSCEG